MTYLERTREALEHLEFLVLDADLMGIARLAHDLKSTSGSFGVRRFHYLAEGLETVAKTGDAAAVAELLPRVREASEAPSETIARRLAPLEQTVEGDRRAS